VLLFKTGLGAVNVHDRVALLELPFERLEHHGVDGPILIANDATRNFRAFNANVKDDGDCFVIASQVAKRRPVVVFLSRHSSR